MSTLESEVIRVFLTSRRDTKSLYGHLAHLTSEVGELAEAVEHHEGDLPHKTMSEPLVGEVADVIQCALSVLTRATPELSDDARLELLVNALGDKTNKWAKILLRAKKATQVDFSLEINPVSVEVKSAALDINLDELAEPAQLPALPPIPEPAPPPPPPPKPRLEQLVPQLQVPPTHVPTLTNIIEPQELKLFMPRLTEAPEPTVNLPKVYTVIREHPLGAQQPIGRFRLHALTRTDDGKVEVRIAQGSWVIDLTKADPEFLDFVVLDGTKGGRKVPLIEALEFWEKSAS